MADSSHHSMVILDMIFKALGAAELSRTFRTREVVMRLVVRLQVPLRHRFITLLTGHNLFIAS